MTLQAFGLTKNLNVLSAASIDEQVTLLFRGALPWTLHIFGFDFCMSQKVGKQFKVQHHYIKNGQRVEEDVQRLNRFFITVKGGALVKVKEDGSISRLVVGQSIGLFNKFHKSDDYDLKYDYYVAEANKLINAVDNGQLNLF